MSVSKSEINFNDYVTASQKAYDNLKNDFRNLDSLESGVKAKQNNLDGENTGQRHSSP
mgnify:CR=1 FL=1